MNTRSGTTESEYRFASRVRVESAARGRRSANVFCINNMRSLVLIPLIPVVLAFELPFGLGKLFGSKPAVQQPLQPQPVTAVVEGPRIAVIGAGAAGSSAAFWLSKGKERSNLTFDVDVYERSDYIGGRESPVCSFPQ